MFPLAEAFPVAASSWAVLLVSALIVVAWLYHLYG
jgi:uncharacterized membrane protein